MQCRRLVQLLATQATPEFIQGASTTGPQRGPDDPIQVHSAAIVAYSDLDDEETDPDNLLSEEEKAERERKRRVKEDIKHQRRENRRSV